MLDNNFDQSANTNISNPPGGLKSFFGSWLLLVVTAIFLIVLVFVIGLGPQGEKADTRLQTEVNVLSDKLGLAGGLQPQILRNYQNYLKAVPTISGKGGQYKQVNNLAQGIMAAYSQGHDPKLREFLGQLESFAKNNYPSFYKTADFFISCADEKCAKLEYKPGVLEIKNLAEKADLGPNKKGAIDALYNASLVPNDKSVNDNGRLFDNLSYVLMISHMAAQNGSVSAKSLEAMVSEYLVKNFPGFVNPYTSVPSAEVRGLKK